MSGEINRASFMDNVSGFFHSAYKTVTSEYTVIFSDLQNVVKGLQGIGLFAINNPVVKKALAIGSVVNFLFKVLPAIPKLRNADLLRREMFEHVAAPNPLDLRDKRIVDLTKACTYIHTNEKRIRKTFDINKTAKIKERAEAILQGISSGANTLEADEEFAKTLRTRANTKVGIDLAKLITKVGGLAVSTLLVAAPTSLILLTFAGVVGITAITLWAIDKIKLPKHSLS